MKIKILNKNCGTEIPPYSCSQYFYNTTLVIVRFLWRWNTLWQFWYRECCTVSLLFIKSDNDNLGEKILHFIWNLKNLKKILYHVNISLSAIIMIVYRKWNLCFGKPYNYTIKFLLNDFFIEKIISTRHDLVASNE